MKGEDRIAVGSRILRVSLMELEQRMDLAFGFPSSLNKNGSSSFPPLMRVKLPLWHASNIPIRMSEGKAVQFFLEGCERISWAPILRLAWSACPEIIE